MEASYLSWHKYMKEMVESSMYSGNTRGVLRRTHGAVRAACLVVVAVAVVLALAGLFILLAGCLQSEPIQSETTTVQLDTPSAGWQLAPLEAWETDEAIYCLFQLSPPQGLSAQVITSIVSEMQLPASEKLKKRVVLGKTWNWSSASDVEFPNSLEAFKEQLGEGTRSVDLLTPES